LASAPDFSYPLACSGDSVLIPVFRTLEKVLDSDTTVLIEGESGAGKEALAHWLHSTGSRINRGYRSLCSLNPRLISVHVSGVTP
jgi:DNA-binding NtrC family response regulator